MPGRIDCYIDTVSPYSWYATKYLLSQKPILASHDITVELHPVFLGAIQVATKNIPPFQIPAKHAYSAHDGPKAASHFGVTFRGAPSWFPMKSLPAQRALVVIKDLYGEQTFERVVLLLFEAVWRDWRNLGDPKILEEVLGDVFFKVDVGGGWKHTTAREVKKVMGLIQTAEVKEKLNAETKKALDLGAFGAPFFYARKWKDGENGEAAVGEPFFGSDRFEYMFDYLELPLQRMRILEKGESQAKL